MLLEKTTIKLENRIVTLYLYTDRVLQKERIDGKYYQSTLTKEPALCKWYYHDFVNMYEKQHGNSMVTYYI